MRLALFLDGDLVLKFRPNRIHLGEPIVQEGELSIGEAPILLQTELLADRARSIVSQVFLTFGQRMMGKASPPRRNMEVAPI